MSTLSATAEPPSSKRRIMALDIMRGYFILVIASVHLGYWPSILSLFDGRGQLWVSEADGFFLISGLVIGIIRRRDLLECGLKTATSKLWSRAAKLYLVCVVLSLAYVAWGRAALHLSISGAKGGLDTAHSWSTLAKMVLTLQYTYGWADFLAYYAVFMLIAPLVLIALRRNLWWVVLGATLAIWVWQWSIEPGGQLQAFAIWQMPFFIGCLIGYYWDSLQQWVTDLTPTMRHRIGYGFVTAGIFIYVASFLTVIIPWELQDWAQSHAVWGRVVTTLGQIGHSHWYDRLLMNQRSGLLRPLLLVVGVGALYVLICRFETKIIRVAGWLLLPAGRNSLYVYILESLLLFALPFFTHQGSFIVNSLLETGMIAIIWLALRYRVLFSIIPR